MIGQRNGSTNHVHTIGKASEHGEHTVIGFATAETQSCNHGRTEPSGIHGGGYLGSYAPRSDRACFVPPQTCNPDIVLKNKRTEYLNQLHFESLVFTPDALRHLVAQVVASQVMIGTDHPIPGEDHPGDHVFATKSLSDDEKIGILGGNAARLFGMSS